MQNASVGFGQPLMHFVPTNILTQAKGKLFETKKRKESQTASITGSNSRADDKVLDT